MYRKQQQHQQQQKRNYSNKRLCCQLVKNQPVDPILTKFKLLPGINFRCTYARTPGCFGILCFQVSFPLLCFSFLIFLFVFFSRQHNYLKKAHVVIFQMKQAVCEKSKVINLVRESAAHAFQTWCVCLCCVCVCVQGIYSETVCLLVLFY